MADNAALSDDQLINLLKKDNRDAFTAIYHRYGKSLASFAASGSRLNDLDDASDVLHDLFIWLWEERNQLNITGDLKTYLFTALRNRIIDHIRKNNTRQRYADLLKLLAVNYENSIELLLDAKELSQVLDDALTVLPPRVQQIFRLSRQDHLSIKESIDYRT
jgi:RNA polymerase sigma factor (sigma-70 family)